MSRVLLTGASGFIGRHAIEGLSSRGYEVHTVTRQPLPFHAGDVQQHLADLMVERELRSVVEAVRPSHLLHCAWYAVPGKFWMAAENLDWVSASLQLLRAFCASGGRRAVMAGSCAEYDWSGEVLSEADTPLRPQTLYGHAKNSLRELVETAAPILDLSFAWGRIFWLYGPHEAPGRLVCDVTRAMVRGEVAKCSHGRQQRDFLHVVDVANALVALLDSEVLGAVNIASGEALPVRSIVERIATLIGRTDLPRFGELSASPKEPSRLVADVRRLREQVGFRPRFDLATGLADTVDWQKHATLGAHS
jgi:nucleoside-diphosphate-sugar epimerase